MSNYLIELSVIHIGMILGYWVFLRKERQYDKMRFYLITSTALAVAIPLLRLPNLFFNNSEPIDAVFMQAITVDSITVAPVNDTSLWNYDILLWSYLGISAIFFLKLLCGVLYLVYLSHNSSYEKFHGVDVRKLQHIKGSFTFFNWIFLGDDIDPGRQDYAAILRHEKAHASLGHSYDLMFFELFKVCFWWLPTAWFINKEIREIHEYQADARAIKSYSVEQYSSILIASTLKSNGIRLASSFHDSLIFKRLIAMKQQSKKVSPWKLGALFALSTLLFIFFACSEEPGKDQAKDGAGESAKVGGDIFTVVEAQPEFPGGIGAFREYIMTEIRYPSEARRKGVEGRVDVEFVVDKDGSLSEVKAIKGIGSGCDEEAVRVLKNAPAFKPATQNGKRVRVRMVVPVTFKLNEKQRNPDNSNAGVIVIEEVEPRNNKMKVDAEYYDGEWSGTVYDEQGERLPGANIVIFGTTTGTTSNQDGTFRIKANKSDELYLSFVGYETVKFGGKSDN